MKPISKKKLLRLHHAFCAMSQEEDLAALLGTERFKLQLLAARPEYTVLQIPKKDGSMRHLENPIKPLKKVQRQLNDCLQAVYWHLRTDAAYGFLVVPRNDPSPRHIITNAQQHLGCQWMLNLDFEDFFHRVTEAMVLELFQRPPFEFSEALAVLLGKLTCSHGRLPMGAPTSPVLSNLASIGLDHDLMAHAADKGWRYTRYADDLSFSSKAEPISEADIEPIRLLAAKHQFPFNEEKKKLRGPNDTKEVTGLTVGETEVGLPDDFLAGLQEELDRLKTVVHTQFAMGELESPWVERYKQQVAGMLNFAVQVLGEGDELTDHLLDQHEMATDPPDGLMAMNWLDFPYI